MRKWPSLQAMLRFLISKPFLQRMGAVLDLIPDRADRIPDDTAR